MSDKAKARVKGGGIADDQVQLGWSDSRLAWRLIRYLKPYPLPVAGAALLTFAMTGVQLAAPYLVGRFIDDVLSPGGHAAKPHGWFGRAIDHLIGGASFGSGAEGVHFYAVVIACTFLFGLVVNVGATFVLQWIGQLVMRDLRKEIFSHVTELPVTYFDRNPVGRLVTRVTNDIGSLNELLSGGFITLIQDVFTVTAIVTAMLLLDFKLSLMCLVTFPVLILVVRELTKRIRFLLREVKRLIAVINSTINENVTGIKVTQLFSREPYQADRFDRLLDEYQLRQIQMVRVTSYFLPTAAVFSGILVMLVLGQGGNQTLEGLTTVGTLVTFLAYTQQLYLPIRTFTDKYNVLLLAMASAERIFTLLDEPAEQDRPAGSAPTTVPVAVTPASPQTPLVEFDHVTLDYREGVRALDDLSLKIPARQAIAVVGPTGAGKTTLISMLARFYDHSSGAVRVAGRDTRDLKRGELRKTTGVVQQDVFLFSGSLADNLFIPDSLPEAERTAKVEKVFGDLGCESFLQKLPQGARTPVRERGNNFSAGERQLIAFARVLVADPEILILDEATANVDTETEQLIQKAIEELTRNRTSIIIAHRLSTILHCDRIVVMNRGKVVEDGPHSELVKAGGVYARLYELQFRGQEGTAPAVDGAAPGGIPAP